jgi:hypothetical protein
MVLVRHCWCNTALAGAKSYDLHQKYITWHASCFYCAAQRFLSLIIHLERKHEEVTHHPGPRQRLRCTVFAQSGNPSMDQAAPASPHTLTGNAGLFSSYRFRGIDQTFGKPALQGVFDYSHSSGIYVVTGTPMFLLAQVSLIATWKWISRWLQEVFW